MTTSKLKKALYWICLILSPIILVAIELFHPAGFTKDPGMFKYLSIAEHSFQHNALGYFGPKWWFTLHMIQTPLIGLVAVGIVLLVWSIKPEDGLFPYLASLGVKISSFLVMIYYTSLDAIGGIGLGRTLEITKELQDAGQLSPEQVSKIAIVLDKTWTDPWVGGVGSFISHTASWSIFFAALFAALALFLSKKVPWPPLVLFVLFGWEVQVSHASYHGPIGFGLLTIAAVWIWLTSRRNVLGT